MWRTSIKPGTGQLRQAADVFQRRWRSQAQRQGVLAGISFGTSRLAGTLQRTGIDPVSDVSFPKAAAIVAPIATAAVSQRLLDDLLTPGARPELS